MGKPVHRFLEEFVSDDGHSSAVVLSLRPRPVERIAVPDPMTITLQEAYARGRQEGEGAARATVEFDMAALAADCERRLEVVKALFSKNTADNLARELREGLSQIGAHVSEQVAIVLLPFLGDRVAKLAIREFATELRSIVEDTRASIVELSGPDELVKPLLLQLENETTWKAGSAGPEIRRGEGGQSELRAVIDCSVIETRLAEWIERIKVATR